MVSSTGTCLYSSSLIDSNERIDKQHPGKYPVNETANTSDLLYQLGVTIKLMNIKTSR
jgi:hypothetical protein